MFSRRLWMIVAGLMAISNSSVAQSCPQTLAELESVLTTGNSLQRIVASGCFVGWAVQYDIVALEPVVELMLADDVAAVRRYAFVFLAMSVSAGQSSPTELRIEMQSAAVTALTSDPNLNVRAAAADIIGLMDQTPGLAGVPSPLLDLLAEDDTMVARMAFNALKGLEVAPTDQILQNLLVRTVRPEAKQRSFAMGTIGVLFAGAPSLPPEVLPVLIAGLADQDHNVRIQAAEGLKHIGPAAQPAAPDLNEVVWDPLERENVRHVAENAYLYIMGEMPLTPPWYVPGAPPPPPPPDGWGRRAD